MAGISKYIYDIMNKIICPPGQRTNIRKSINTLQSVCYIHTRIFHVHQRTSYNTINSTHTIRSRCAFIRCNFSLVARFMGLTWGPPGANRGQIDPMLAPWTLLSGFCEATQAHVAPMWQQMSCQCTGACICVRVNFRGRGHLRHLSTSPNHVLFSLICDNLTMHWTSESLISP